ncbi:MAG: amidohydrolase family protein [Planctomycetaceae bacterium]
MIIDGHVHVSDSDFGNVDVLLAQWDQAGIERGLCVPGGMVDVRQFSRIFSGQYRPDPHIPNHLVFDAIERHGDRIEGLVCVNPHDGPEAVTMLEEGLDRGCRGVKLAPIVHQFQFSDPVLDEIASCCGDRGFPVYSHVLPNPGMRTSDFSDLARRNSGTNFMLGHMGFGPADADAIEFASELDNLYLESSLGNYLILRDALERLGPTKLVFGSEFPLSHPKAELEKILLLDAASHDAILRANILRLLQLES